MRSGRGWLIGIFGLSLVLRLWLWRELVKLDAKYRLWRAVGKPERWLDALKTSSTARGRFRWYRAGFTI